MKKNYLKACIFTSFMLILAGCGGVQTSETSSGNFDSSDALTNVSSAGESAEEESDSTTEISDVTSLVDSTEVESESSVITSAVTSESESETSVATSEEDPVEDYSNVTYEINDSEVTVTGVVDESATEIVIPELIDECEVVEIEFGAFEDCVNLKSIKLPFVGESATTDKNGYLGYVFGAPSNYDNDDYVPFNLTEVTVTGNANIAQKAFSQCNFLYEINLSNDVAEIGDFAFENCENLSLITIPSALSKINNGTFWFCVSITFVAIPDRVRTISSLSFNNCSRLASAVIPESVETIEEYAFNSCSRLEKIFFKGDTAAWEAISISEENAELNLAEKYFYSEADPTETGNYWHCVNGDIVIW